MRTKVAIAMIACLVAVATLCVAQPGGSSPNPATDLATLGAQLHQTQAQLERAVSRVGALEEQVLALQKSNAELQLQLRTIQAPHSASVQSNQVPQALPAPQAPQAPQGLRLVPLQPN